MAPGSALNFLASAYHGGGHNSVPGSTRTMHSLFFIRGNLRPEENYFLAIPREKVVRMNSKMLALLGWQTPPRVPLGTVEGISPVEDMAGIWERVLA